MQEIEQHVSGLSHHKSVIILCKCQIIISTY